ncbi:helix-turn-helix domain-containing protein [Phaeobacter sp. HF9A]|uniref:helix-turn-helix domain-containing protein n=1 Tax=Phaeobacter sp. HF9A TaxID=2721561 RepID=UPI001430413F|nr:helix-turn-helix domain-containing protein [Phaeobacter sp. HF9A]NIZ13530.1 helix-turn-helix transcriptional regulator [Phaeobacter sp. HF9A]
MQGFGAELKSWRQTRRQSQLDLALAAEVSARHISFLETGRANPSRDMVLRLSAALLLSPEASNRLMSAAGHTPAYGARSLSDAEMAPLRAAVDWTLERHAPYPAMALGRHWQLIRLNAPAEQLLAATGLGEGDSFLEAFLESDALRARIDNLAELERLLLLRLRSELLHFGRDAVLEHAVARLQARQRDLSAHDSAPLPPMIPARYRVGGRVLSFFSAVSQFGSVEDIALCDLRIESLFPADEATRQALLS